MIDVNRLMKMADHVPPGMAMKMRIFGNELAYDGAFSRGKVAKRNGDGAGSNPFDQSSPYFSIWEAGFESAKAA